MATTTAPVMVTGTGTTLVPVMGMGMVAQMAHLKIHSPIPQPGLLRAIQMVIVVYRLMQASKTSRRPPPL
jgi:hypothetical protein